LCLNSAQQHPTASISSGPSFFSSHSVDLRTTLKDNQSDLVRFKMTSPVETAVNGTQNNDADPKTSSPPSQQTTSKPKANGVNGSAETHGLTTDDSAAISNGEGSNATTESIESHLSIATPPTSMSGSQADIMEQIPFGESQQSQSEESDPGDEKRDLYVGNLYRLPRFIKLISDILVFSWKR
jgi:hypothetical protein